MVQFFFTLKTCSCFQERSLFTYVILSFTTEYFIYNSFLCLQNIDQLLVFYQEHLCAIINVSNVHNKAVTRNCDCCHVLSCVLHIIIQYCIYKEIQMFLFCAFLSTVDGLRDKWRLSKDFQDGRIQF